MENQQINNLDKLSPKVRLALFSLINDFYSVAKQNTIIVMPFFGLLHSQGNESKPILNYIDVNILDIMKSQFKDVVVYPGENRYLGSYNLSLSSVEHLAHQQNILSRIINRTTNFDKLSDKHNQIIYEYKKALNDFDTMKEKNPLPYKTAFNIRNPKDLISFVKNMDKTMKQENKNFNICLICPITYLTEHTSQTYNSIVKAINSIDGTLYFAQNQSDMCLYNNYHLMLYDDQYPQNFVHSIQGFVNTYSKEITSLAKKVLNYEMLIQSIINGNFGSSDSEIISNLENIDITKIYSNYCNNKILFKK